MVIIPIYWNMKHQEKDAVLKAAARVQQLLQEAGLSTNVDAANQYTPGQKMKYWWVFCFFILLGRWHGMGPRSHAETMCLWGV